MKMRAIGVLGATALFAVAGFAGPAAAGGANDTGPFYNDCQSSGDCLPSGNGQGMASDGRLGRQG